MPMFFESNKLCIIVFGLNYHKVINENVKPECQDIVQMMKEQIFQTINFSYPGRSVTNEVSTFHVIALLEVHANVNSNGMKLIYMQNF